MYKHINMKQASLLQVPAKKSKKEQNMFQLTF